MSPSKAKEGVRLVWGLLSLSFGSTPQTHQHIAIHRGGRASLDAWMGMVTLSSLSLLDSGTKLAAHAHGFIHGNAVVMSGVTTSHSAQEDLGLFWAVQRSWLMLIAWIHGHGIGMVMSGVI